MHEKLARYWSKLQGNSAAVYRVHRHTKAWEQIREPDGAARYALKYALKTRQKTVPSQYRDVGRFWGCSRSVRDGVQAEHEQAATEDDIRAIVSRVRPDFNAKCGKFLPKYIFLPNLS